MMYLQKLKRDYIKQRLSSLGVTSQMFSKTLNFKLNQLELDLTTKFNKQESQCKNSSTIANLKPSKLPTKIKKLAIKYMI